ncbi:P-loop NTPase fold protein [Mucilaginibacter sp. 22184]|uniref:P-loop NTPase fold protein n=1 Tax=Mucilaginibacter sp. 22184 TaxID=3453887 RepID=UPI003F83E02B
MPKKELTYIETTNLTSEFEQHLSDKFNERILFSAPFGAGKSTFLKKFFDETEDYIVLKLYPVNYSVAPNQDVFELIKYELLYELLNRFPEEIELNQDQFSMLLVSQMFFLHQMKIDLPLKLLAKASSLVPGGDTANDTIVDAVTQTINSFKDYKKNVNKTEYDMLKDHIKAVQGQKGHIYECDDITQLIISLLERIKTKKIETKPTIKTVLLIDDLDRLDPEHVFRLFNVFSAHYDDATESNKFFFNKVIFVCDVKNIREMFSHRYGFNVEFTGYIDKFYSTEVFNFNIKKYLKESLSMIFNESVYYPYENFGVGGIGNSLVERYLLKPRQIVYEAMISILKDMIDLNIVRIRNFRRFNKYTLPNNVIETKYGYINEVFFPITVLFTNLEKLFIHQIDIENSFELLYKNYKSSYDLINPTNRSLEDQKALNLIHYSLPFILDEHIIFGNDQKKDVQYSQAFNNENNLKIFIVYTLNYDWDNSIWWPKYIKCTLEENSEDGSSQNSSVLRPNPYWFILMAYRNFKGRKSS